MKELQTKETDKIEQVKQSVKEIQTVYLGTSRLKENHTLFEFDRKLLTIEKATFDELPAVKFEDAMKGNISSKKKITIKDNCIYIPALNKKNVIKILKRDYNIII